MTREGNQKYYQAQRESPVFPELHGLIVKTVGVVDPLRAALAPLTSRIHLAFVFGSVAKARERAGSDIDLLVVTDNLAYADIYAALETAEKSLARTINPTVFTSAEWKSKRARNDSFAARITAQRRLFVIGNDDGPGMNPPIALRYS
ncbi:MAG TPA: nucleotidyltransferase domain-containing protein [Thermoanaerobaculia bacterium]|nr:nucleotidyltransferase domain-containing protein [Thermoanaerobaculia bacterium]